MKTGLNKYVKSQLSTGVLMALLTIAGIAKSFASPINPPRDTSISAEIKMQLGDFNSQKLFHFPKSVFRFYRQHSFQPVWVDPSREAKYTWEAVLMLNCVLQFGLCHDDYHPKEIDYTRLRLILEHPEQVNNNEKAGYDLMITDAMITFMNHLHYGKLNPNFPSSKIDAGADTSFRAGKTLGQALRQPHFMSAIVAVQPVSKAYTDLEEQMRKLTQTQEDCQGLPGAEVRKMAINLERLRWISAIEPTYIQLNIPAYKLIFHLPDTSLHFKAVVGSPSSPTPQLNSAITNFTTASKLKISRRAGEASGTINPKGVIYFWFKNSYGISICGRPEKDIFDPKIRDLSKGGIRVQDGERLALLMLKVDDRREEMAELKRVIDDYAIKNFVLNTPVPLKITYITCEAWNDAVIVYPDIYNLDNKLEEALYNVEQPLVSN